MSEDKFLEYPHEMIERCADNCDTMRDKIAKLEAANKVLRETIGDLLDALAVARNRIEYLGALSTNEKHSQANDEVFLPVIDDALKAAYEIERGN